MIAVEEAWDKIAERARPLSTEVRELDRCEGYVLAQRLTAPIDLPSFDNSAMDGYALRGKDTRSAHPGRPVKLTVSSEVAAGERLDTPVTPGTAVKIMTGAPLPPGADTVLKLEAGRLRKEVVEIDEPLATGRHVRRRGEDVQSGAPLFGPGTLLNAQRLGLLANCGIAAVEVHRKARLALVTTGSELASPGEQPGPGQIYDANRPVLRALLAPTGCGVDDLGIVGDDAGRIAERARLGLESDLLLITGGVSVGKHDHVKAVVKELGAEVVFWRVKMKPGKPLLCARLGDRWIFGLPGNPISCVVAFLVFIEPLLRRLNGEDTAQPRYARAVLTRAVSKNDERRTFLTAQVERTPEGQLVATATEKQGSAMMQALAQANGFIVVPEDRMEVAAGERVDVLLLGERWSYTGKGNHGID